VVCGFDARSVGTSVAVVCGFTGKSMAVVCGSAGEPVVTAIAVLPAMLRMVADDIERDFERLNRT
jgi:hypothetical protein